MSDEHKVEKKLVGYVNVGTERRPKWRPVYESKPKVKEEPAHGCDGD